MIAPPPILRESNFELLRLISQFAIVLYHILMLFVYPATNAVIFKALYLPLHVGVILFVLLSGFFLIKPSTKGFIKLFGIFFVYTIPELVWNISHAEDLQSLLHSLLFLSNTHFWFIKTYLFLYLLSPMVNNYLRLATNRQLLYIVIALAFVCNYMAMTGGDHNMADGKNVANFIFIYSVGYTLKRFQQKWKESSYQPYILFYIILNTLLVVIYSTNFDNVIGHIIWQTFFPYSSIGLLLNSTLLFVIVGKKTLSSKKINYLAMSSLAIYLLHANRPYLVSLLGKGAFTVMSYSDNYVSIIIGCILLSILTICICIIIDKLLSPIWNTINKAGQYVYTKIGY